MSRALAIALVALTSSPAAAQVVVDDEEAARAAAARTDHAEDTFEGLCGIAFTMPDGTKRDSGIDGEIGHGFRGLGSPGHDAEAALDYGMALRVDGGPASFDALLRGTSVFANLSSQWLGRACATAGVDLDLVGGWHDGRDGEASGSRFAARLGILARTRHDDTRLHLEVEGVFPAFDSDRVDALSPRRVQAGVHGALAHRVDDEILSLGPLQWGVRGIGRLDFQFHEPGNARSFSAWLELRVALGYARIASVFGPREGLVGGVRLGLLGGGPTGRGVSFRAGIRAAVSVGTLWPTDVIFPFDVTGVIEVAHVVVRRLGLPPLGGSMITVEGGLLGGRLPIPGLGEEWYARFGVSYTAFVGL